MISLDLSGHTALVTGGSGALGRAMVRTLAEAGADVAVHFHANRSQADALVAELEAMGRRAVAVQADVTDAASVDAMRDAVVDTLGAPDIVVANAVIQYEWTTILDQPLADFDSQYQSCVLQSVHLAKAFVPAMTEAGWGRVIGINTEVAMMCDVTQAAYAAAKRGMDGFYRVLAREVGPQGVTVNQVAPGWTLSELVEEPDSEHARDYRAGVPLRRHGTAQEIANVVAFLASDLASFITGATVPVSGGNVMPTI